MEEVKYPVQPNLSKSNLKLNKVGMEIFLMGLTEAEKVASQKHVVQNKYISESEKAK
jgi:hypothetical protein